MSTTPDQTTETIADDAIDAATDSGALKKALKAERAARKAAEGKLAAIGDGNIDRLVTERTATLTAQVAAAEKKAADTVAAWDAARVDQGIAFALGKCGMIPANHEDATAMLRPILEVNKDGAIVTKAGPNVIAGMTVEQHIHAVLKAARPHWWSLSQGGGAKPGASHVPASVSEASCFDRSSPKYSVTAQAQYERRFGVEAARRAARQYGGTLAGEGGHR